MEQERYSEKSHWGDLAFLQQDSWLEKGAVCLNIEQRFGRYWVILVYVENHQPFRFRLRYIADYATELKARRSGEFFLRGVRRDPRGTFKIDIDAFYLCRN